MTKILIFGNSGSGKSTLAKALCATKNAAHLDLDTLAWKPVSPPERAPLEESARVINNFINLNQRWVIEGCYTDLLELALPDANDIIFMNLPVEMCIANARQRPWEPHKYESKQAQDANLDMLLEWISQYKERNDTFSYTSHLKMYETFTGKKKMYLGNQPNNITRR